MENKRKLENFLRSYDELDFASKRKLFDLLNDLIHSRITSLVFTGRVIDLLEENGYKLDMRQKLNLDLMSGRLEEDIQEQKEKQKEEQKRTQASSSFLNRRTQASSSFLNRRT